MLPPLEGLLAATFSPCKADGALDLTPIPTLVERLLGDGITGFYVCGSTGEGASMTVDERRQVAEAYVRAAAGRVPVIVQVGHDSLAQARQLARHAVEIGADAVSAVPPVYFKPSSLAELVGCLAEVARAVPDTPFLYYHIPALTGLPHSGLALLEAAARVPNFAGIKYTDPLLDDFQACLELGGERHQVLFGRDEMLLAALAVGARGFIGSTYNLVAPVYRELLAAWDAGDLVGARARMSRAQAFIRLLPKHGRGSQKAIHALLHGDLGPSRAPIDTPTGAAREALAADLEALGVRQWS
ncbi:MAG: dihydrodipicolinate synthase family protein [Planctomycetota bacterium]|nr:dihydrodipicolinate synthase family protein [Planctomycetota bacterium]